MHYVISYLYLDKDECSSSPCMYEGTCQDEIDHYKCECLPGYNGTHCEIGRYY